MQSIKLGKCLIIEIDKNIYECTSEQRPVNFSIILWILISYEITLDVLEFLFFNSICEAFFIDFFSVKPYLNRITCMYK